MNEVVVLKPIPKQESLNYEGHRYILKFEPHEPPERRWSWCVHHTVTFYYFGHAATNDAASRQAKAQIRKLVKKEEASG